MSLKGTAVMSTLVINLKVIVSSELKAPQGFIELMSGLQTPTSRPQEPAESSTNKNINRENKRRCKNNHKRYRPHTKVGRILSV